MAAKASEPTTPVQHIQHERFTTKEHGYRLLYLSLGLSGNVAVSGFNINSRRTYIDLYSGNSFDSRDKLKLFYSKEFEKYSNYRLRYVSFLDKNVSKLVTCIGDKIEIIDTKNESKVLRSCRVNGRTACLAVREGEIFIGLWKSQTSVLVFNNDLKETKKIRREGIQDGDYPWHLQVIKDTIFVRTRYGRALTLSVYDGSIVSEFTDTTEMYSIAISIAVSEELSLVAVVWYKRPAQGIIVYSLNENKSLLVFDVDYDVTRIRISDRDRMLVTGNQDTGEIKMYDLGQLFNFEAMKWTLACLVAPEEYDELRKYFGVTEEEIQRSLGAGDEDKSKKLSNKQKTVRKMECLLTVIEEKGHLNPYNVNKLADAVSNLTDEICIPDLKGPLGGYSLHGILGNMKITVTEMMTRQKTWENERTHLSSRLETADREVKSHKKTFDDLQGKLERVTKEAKEQQPTLRGDLKFGELKIMELEGGKMTLTQAPQQCYKQMETLTEELQNIHMKFTTDVETLKNELKQTKQIKTNSDRQIQTMTEEVTQVRTDCTTKIETLSKALKQTQIKFAAAIETVTGAMAMDLRQSKIESYIQREAMRKELTQKSIESTHRMETLIEELQQTPMEFATEIKSLREELGEVKIESGEIKMLTNELEWTQRRAATEIESLTEELAEVKRESDEKREMLREELEQNQKESETEIDTLRKELTKVERESDEIEMLTKELKETQRESVREIETLTEEVTEVKRESGEIEMLTKELKRTQREAATEIESLTEELAEVKRETGTKIEMLTEELKRTQREAATEIDTLRKELTKVERESDEIEMLTKELEETQRESVREIETLTEEVTEVKRESGEIEMLTKELKRTQREAATEIESLTEELAEVKRESDAKIEMLTEELEQTEMKSATEIETLTEELTEAKRESGTKIEVLTKEFQHTQMRSAAELEILKKVLTEVKRESDTKIEMLTQELEQIQMRSATEIESLKEELTEEKRQSDEKIEMLTEELEQTKIKSATEIETLREELTEVTESLM